MRLFVLFRESPSSSSGAVIKIEPREEPMELTSQNRGDQISYGSIQPLNISQSVGISQHLPATQSSRSAEVKNQ